MRYMKVCIVLYEGMCIMSDDRVGKCTSWYNGGANVRYEKKDIEPRDFRREEEDHVSIYAFPSMMFSSGENYTVGSMRDAHGTK